MALKLVLLSNNAVENKESQYYKIFDNKIKKNLIKLSNDQKKSLGQMNISNKKFRGSELNIEIDLGGLPSKMRLADAEIFKLNCIQIINIFSKISEPISIDHRNYEYLLVADRTNELSTEIHSVINVTASEPGAKIPKLIPID